MAVFCRYLADCAVCSHRYTESLSYTCRECSDDKVTVVAWLALPSTIALALLFLGYMVSKERRSAKRVFIKTLQKLPLQSTKIVIVAWQIITEARLRWLMSGFPSRKALSCNQSLHHVDIYSYEKLLLDHCYVQNQTCKISLIQR